MIGLSAVRPWPTVDDRMNRLRILGGTVLTLDASGAVFDPGEVLVEDGRIAAVGPRGGLTPHLTMGTSSVPYEPYEETIDASGALILPGLVNAHCHSSDTLVRGTAPMLPLEAWSQFSDAGRFGRTPREIYLSAMLTAIEALKTGTTTILDHLRLSPGLTLEGLEAAARAYIHAGIRAVIAPVLSDLPVAETLPLDMIDLPPAHAANLRRAPMSRQEQVDLCQAFIGKWKTRIGVQVGPSAPHRCSDALLECCGEMAARHHVRLHMHFLETAAQAVVARRRFRDGTARHLAALGLLPQASLVHCVYADEDDLDVLASSGAMAVHCPVANLRLGSGTMPWYALATRGARIALGTDGVLCNDSLSMLTVMKTVGLLHAEDSHLEPSDILRAATAYGAAVCGLHDVGAIEAGRRADLSIIESPPTQDSYTTAVLGLEWQRPVMVIVGGTVVVRDGRLTMVDEGAVAAEARDVASALIRRNAARFAEAREMVPFMQRLAARAKEVEPSTRSGKVRSASSS